ncbi:hypothetical protein BGW42_008651 [Actinomortierella wolfii]|nr:hypothetical protein BGW42_008651 [Actinomortierella wolfii]
MTRQKLTLYQNPKCPYAQRALIALEITKQEAEKVFIDLTVPREEWYLKINPYGQVPALKVEGDDFVILESSIVAQYIAELHPESNLIPTDPKQRAESNYLIHHFSNRLHPAHWKLTYTLDKSVREANSAEFIKQLEIFNEWLSKATQKTKGPYVHGDQFTLVDLNLAPLLARYFVTEVYQEGYKLPTIESHPHLARYFEWRDAVLSHPAVVATTISKEEIADTLRKFLK